MSSDRWPGSPTTIVPAGEPGRAPATWDHEAWRHAPSAARTRPGSSLLVHLLLFVATFATTTIAGTMHAGVDLLSGPFAWLEGLRFSVPLLAILLSHEMGHYTLALYHGVPTTLPYFIPGPPFLVGTFGAFIRMSGMPRSRRSLFDVGAAGPWAGILVAIPITAYGLMLSDVQPNLGALGGGLTLGDSLLFRALSRLVLGVNPDDVTILLHPTALAGWFGIFVTFLNLLPVGQLDGGHVVYALFGRAHRVIARIGVLGILCMGFLGWDGWYVWSILLVFVLKVDHPETVDPVTELDPRRRAMAWATVALFFVTFMPVPLSVVEGPDLRETIPSLEREAPRAPRRPGRPGPAGPMDGVSAQDQQRI